MFPASCSNTTSRCLLLSSARSVKEKNQELAALIERASAAELDPIKLVIVDERYRILSAASFRDAENASSG